MFHFHNSANITEINKKSLHNNHNIRNSNNNINNNNNNQLKSHKMHLESAKKLRSHHQEPHHGVAAVGFGWLQVFLLLTLFVIGNQSAWQENIRPKLYVELGK